MKLKILYLFIGLFLVVGCQEDDNVNDEITDFEYFIRFKANGLAKEYRFVINNAIPETRLLSIVNGDDSMWGEFSYDEEGYLSLVNATSGTNSENAEVFQIVIFTEEPITVNEDYTHDNTLIISTFYSDSMNVYDSDQSDNMQIIWTSITETETRGRFSGTLHDENDVLMEITDGEFYIFNSSQ